MIKIILALFLFVSPVFAGCYFDGIDDYINLGDIFDYGTAPFSVSLWIKPATIQNDYANIIDKDHTGTKGWAFEYDVATDKVYFFFGSGSGNTGTTPITTTGLKDNKWHCLTGTYSGTQIKIYVDGVLEDTKNWTYGFSNSGNLSIGKWNTASGREFTGIIDCVSIFNRVLTENEIKNLTKKRYIKSSGCVGYWRFQGENFDGKITKDMSGNGNSGIHTGTSDDDNAPLRMHLKLKLHNKR